MLAHGSGYILSTVSAAGLLTNIGAGGSLYTRYCAICHGVGAISGGALPDVRHSAMIGSAEAFRSVVIDGALIDKGMPPWSEVLSDDDAEAIRAFIVFMANQ